MPTKVKIFKGRSIADLEIAINQFIADKVLLDIKFASYPVSTQFNTAVGYPTAIDLYDSIIVVYKDGEASNDTNS